MSTGVVMNRDVIRFMRKEIGHDASVLCHAVAERSGGEYSPLQLEVAYWRTPSDEKPAKLAGMRRIVADFDAGKTVTRDEAENE